MVNMRPFSSFETENIKFLVDHQIDFTTLQITETGLKKSIMDATAPVRTYLKEKGIHDYEAQLQGPENKRLVLTYMMCETTRHMTHMSLYRPITKKGDPRLWMNKVKGIDFLQPNDIFILIAYRGILFAVNITALDIPRVCASLIDSPLKDLIREISSFKSSTGKELLGLIKDKMSDWVPTDLAADTAIGRKIESVLGIGMNASKDPDYKGIELKSHRNKSKDSNVLFTQAPTWEISKLKSGKQIVEKYGYLREGNIKKTLHVTLSSLKPNAQGLGLGVEKEKDVLEAIELLRIPNKDGLYEKVNDVAAWRLMKLHERLLTKHKETFWIEAENKIIDGQEFFRCTEIIHTKNPIQSQFDILLEQGEITVDFLLCRPSGSGDTYSFKVKGRSRGLLFPESETYSL